jgi:hypothetical protein
MTMTMLQLTEFTVHGCDERPEAILYDHDVFVFREEVEGVLRYQSVPFVFVRTHADLQAVVAVH